MATYTNSKTGEKHYVAPFTGAQTDQEVIAAPATGYAIVLHRVMVSSSANATVFFEQGATLVAGAYLLAAGQQAAVWDFPRGSDGNGRYAGRELTNATNLTITTSAGDCYVDIVYTVAAS
ncbi:MAG: hypothetical protein GY767_02525 [Shimia sp.]|nr:hypothetical protein [Shimia sp.]